MAGFSFCAWVLVMLDGTVVVSRALTEMLLTCLRCKQEYILEFIISIVYHILRISYLADSIIYNICMFSQIIFNPATRSAAK